MASKLRTADCGSRIEFFARGTRFGVQRLDAAFETVVARFPFGSKIGIVIYELKWE